MPETFPAHPGESADQAEPAPEIKQSQISATLRWLTENYERAEGVCLPRCVLYTHYLDFCKKMKFTPAGAASFGKVIRQKFPKLTTRRLGTRGQSKYHYYGIGIKETSIYYHSVYSGRGLTRFSGIKIKTEGSSRKYSLSSKTGTLLPDFPDSQNLVLPDDVDREKVETFIMMYRTHCQRILDTVISANFDEVQNFLLHFWQGMPEHLVALLQLDVIMDIVGLCDSILYKVLIDILIPSTIQDLPESLSTEVRLFAKRLPGWVRNSMEDIPEKLKEKKLQVVRYFIKSLRRQTSFVHLAQTARTVLLNHDNITQMVTDLHDLEHRTILSQAMFPSPDQRITQGRLSKELLDEFEGLMRKQAPVEAYTEWVDSVVDRCVLKPSRQKEQTVEDRAQDFLLQWAFTTSKIMRDLTLMSAPSFGSFHLLHMMLDEYVYLVVETQQANTMEVDLLNNLKRHMKTAGEISTKPKVRQTPSSNGLQKSKKRKTETGAVNSGEAPNDAPDQTVVGRNSSTDLNSLVPAERLTAFSRPQTNGYGGNQVSPTVRSLPGYFPSSASLPHYTPVNHYPSPSASAFERGIDYYHQFSGYNDPYSSVSAFSSSPQGARYGDAMSYRNTGAMPAFNQAAASSYWQNGGGMTPSSYAENLHNKGLMGTAAGYEMEKRNEMYRSRGLIPPGGPYEEAQGYIPSAAGYTYGGRGGNTMDSIYGKAKYMEIVPSEPVYGPERQDTFMSREEMYAATLGTYLPQMNKPYNMGPYR
ncbi:DNA-binding protein RFX6-like [Branchiostoma floridae x Branchiostoma belcheri]